MPTAKAVAKGAMRRVLHVAPDKPPVSFPEFKQRMFAQYITSRHIDALDELLTQVALYVETNGAQGIGRVRIEMPSRHSKTFNVGRFFPAWFLGRFPDKRVILASYAAGLAEKSSRQARNLVASPRYQELFPGSRLSPDSRAVNAWNLADREGGMDAVGVGGGVVGRGGHLLIADDLLSGREDAESKPIRDKTWGWFTDDFLTRQEPGAAVILMSCMTGDTPVLMANGAVIPLRDIKAGDCVATYDKGKLSVSNVLNHTSSGRDYIYKIKMTSGKIVRANGRHPFLVDEHGELQWIRLKNLTTAHTIVTLRGNGESGLERPVWSKVAKSLRSVEGIERHTTAKSDGLMDTVLPQKPLRLAARLGLNTDTALLKLNTMLCSLRKRVNALFANSLPAIMSAPIGVANCALTTTTRLIQSERSCATNATSQLGMQKQKQQRLPSLNISDFIAEAIASIEPAGFEEVFDVQIERTENFIANGLVSHNTRWHMDDIAGRVEQRGAKDWHKLILPALAEENDPIGRAVGEALWPERYPVETLLKIRSNGMTEYAWNAEYQQRPVASEGGLFKREWFANPVPIQRVPALKWAWRYWDLAMSSKTSADYTVGLLLAQGEDGHFYICDVSRGQIDWGDVTPFMASVMLKDGPEVIQGIEQQGYMSRAVADLNQDYRLNGYSIFGYKVDRDKVTRALPVAAHCATGTIHLVEAGWNAAFVEEVCSFPVGRNDDQVDALSGVWGMASDSTPDAPSSLVVSQAGRIDA